MPLFERKRTITVCYRCLHPPLPIDEYMQATPDPILRLSSTASSTAADENEASMRLDSTQVRSVTPSEPDYRILPYPSIDIQEESMEDTREKKGAPIAPVSPSRQISQIPTVSV